MVNFMLCVFYHNKKIFNHKTNKKRYQEESHSHFSSSSQFPLPLPKITNLVSFCISFQVFFLQMQVNMKLFANASEYSSLPDFLKGIKMFF